MKKVLVISNPYSGKEIKQENSKDIRNIFSYYGYDPIFIKTEHKGHATEIVRGIDGVDLIVSDGGDGTLHEVIEGNLKRKTPLTIGHLPTGTTNDIGALYGYSKDALTALIQVLDGEEKYVDFFSINDNPFVYVVGAGQFLNIPYTTSKKDKNRFGHVAYVKDGIKAWAKGTPKYHVKYEIDGKEVEREVSIFLASNSTRIAGFSGFFREDTVKLDDGLFEIVMTDLSDRDELFKAAVQLATKGITKVSGAQVIKTDNFKIKFYEKPLYDLCIDGERYEENNKDLEYEFRECNKVKMLLPKKNLNRLFDK